MATMVPWVVCTGIPPLLSPQEREACMRRGVPHPKEKSLVYAQQDINPKEERLVYAQQDPSP